MVALLSVGGERSDPEADHRNIGGGRCLPAGKHHAANRSGEKVVAERNPPNPEVIRDHLSAVGRAPMNELEGSSCCADIHLEIAEKRSLTQECSARPL